MRCHTILSIKDLSLTKPNGCPLIKNANVTFVPGITALVGANGSGKSTLLRCIAGLYPITCGSVRLDTLDNVRHKAAFLERMVFMPQGFAAYPELTGLEFLEYALGTRGSSRRSARYFAWAWLDAVGLGSVAKHKTCTYSQGMLQRLGFAFAMQINVPLYLMDEPFAGVDPESRESLLNLLFTYCQNSIAIISAHYIDEMTHRGATLMRLGDGELVQC